MIAVVVPTVRPAQYEQFEKAWSHLFKKHNVALFTVRDGDLVQFTEYEGHIRKTRNGIPTEWSEVIYNHNDGVRNVGFLSALKSLGKDLKVILTLDDDVMPTSMDQDPIEEHLNALYTHRFLNARFEWGEVYPRKVPISWFSTASEYMRGFPYGVREEAEVWVSHGVWTGVHDYDGPTQLVKGNVPATFYKGPIPKGCYFPMCGMNLAFKVEALPYMYFSPMGPKVGVNRFADIWAGVYAKSALDDLGAAFVSGYSTVYHTRASNVFANLEQEAKGIRWHENWWDKDWWDKDWWDKDYIAPPDSDERTYFDLYAEKRQKWREIVKKIVGESK